jgi:bisphosphoglycerate-independent phosphoglycerate mutase (AlkP superfamily)
LSNVLKKTTFTGPRGPVVLVVMDGIGIGKYEEGDAVEVWLRLSWTRHLDTFVTLIFVVVRAAGHAHGVWHGEQTG